MVLGYDFACHTPDPRAVPDDENVLSIVVEAQNEKHRYEMLAKVRSRGSIHDHGDFMSNQESIRRIMAEKQEAILKCASLQVRLAPFHPFLIASCCLHSSNDTFCRGHTSWRGRNSRLTSTHRSGLLWMLRLTRRGFASCHGSILICKTVVLVERACQQSDQGAGGAQAAGCRRQTFVSRFVCLEIFHVCFSSIGVHIFYQRSAGLCC